MSHDVPFIETSVFHRINDVAMRVVDLGWTAVITGAPGIGKTRAIRFLAELHNPTDNAPWGQMPVAIVDVNSALGRSSRALITEVASALGSSGWCGSFSATLESIQPEEGQLLILDEAQNIKDNLLRDLLWLNEARGLAMIFCGNEQVLRYHNATDGALLQIGRRLKIQENIRSISDDDVYKLTNEFNVEGKDVYEKMCEIGAVRHADGVVTVLRLAQSLAGVRTGARPPIRIAHVEAALDQLPHLSRSVPSRRPGVSKRVSSTP